MSTGKLTYLRRWPWLLLALAAAASSACGNKGPLRLPDAHQPASAPPAAPASAATRPVG